MPDLNPYAPAKRDAERLIKRAKHRMVDLASREVGSGRGPTTPEQIAADEDAA